MKKIYDPLNNNVCLYCGNTITRTWKDYDPVYECNCKDAVKVKQIEKQICNLKSEAPKHKFKLVQETHNTAILVNE